MITPDNSVVVIPTFARPEILAHALMALNKAKDCPPVYVFLDSGAPEGRAEEVAWIVNRYARGASLYFQPEHEKVTSGTWNILKSLQAGYETGAEYVFLVEEDVMMYPDFMARHNELRASGDFEATCGRKVERFFVRYGDMYTNPGSCLTRKLLAELVPHINADYFKHTGEYIDNVFGRQYINSSLDDGLIRMVMWKNNWMCGYPPLDRPIAAHQGFMWYDQIDIYSNRGTLEEKIEGFARITAKMNPTDRYARDFEPFKR
jgi:hypothetical protein